MDELGCQVPGCGVPEDKHKMRAHTFQPSEELLRKSRGAGPALMIAADPVLRMTLIRKGVLTQEDLTSTEQELRAAGLLGGSGAGNRQDREGDRKTRDAPRT